MESIYSRPLALLKDTATQVFSSEISKAFKNAYFEEHLRRTFTNLELCQTSMMESLQHLHCVKSDRIRCYSGPHFPAFGLNTER